MMAQSALQIRLRLLLKFNTSQNHRVLCLYRLECALVLQFRSTRPIFRSKNSLLTPLLLSHNPLPSRRMSELPWGISKVNIDLAQAFQAYDRRPGLLTISRDAGRMHDLQYVLEHADLTVSQKDNALEVLGSEPYSISQGESNLALITDRILQARRAGALNIREYTAMLAVLRQIGFIRGRLFTSQHYAHECRFNLVPAIA